MDLLLQMNQQQPGRSSLLKLGANSVLRYLIFIHICVEVWTIVPLGAIETRDETASRMLDFPKESTWTAL
uniref:Uncharacterized protein n=1 Tax=Romanomermis culicivorax TaxID=13658 RepID=A0A915HSB8_ROMCU